MSLYIRSAELDLMNRLAKRAKGYCCVMEYGGFRKADEVQVRADIEWVHSFMQAVAHDCAGVAMTAGAPIDAVAAIIRRYGIELPLPLEPELEGTHPNKILEVSSEA